MKRIAVLLLLIAAINICSAQHKVVKAQAFFSVSMPGMAMQDENGNVIDPKPIINRFIYIECRFNGKPKVDSVFYNGFLLMPVVEDKEEIATAIGIRKVDGKPVYLIAKKGNHIWKIGLQQTNGIILKYKTANKIIIKGKLDKTKFSYSLTAETELTAADRY